MESIKRQAKGAQFRQTSSKLSVTFIVTHKSYQNNFFFQLLGFMYSWLTFYHSGHEVAKDFRPHMTELQTRIQKVNNSFGNIALNKDS